MYRSLFPKHQEAPRTVRVRVIRSTETHTTVQPLDAPAGDWSLVSARLPEPWPVGTELTMTFTPMELEYLQGRRELES